MPAQFEGRVTWCYDGDTIRVMGVPDGTVIRVWGIDAPERGQRGFGKSGAFLWSWIGKKVCVFEPVCRDRYGRMVAKVVLPPDIDVAQVMVREGWAWWYRRYAGQADHLRRAEMEARAERRGLWAERAGRFAPWVFRYRYGKRGYPGAD